MQNLHQSYDWQYIGQIIGGDFAKFCGLLRIYELYHAKNYGLKWKLLFIDPSIDKLKKVSEKSFKVFIKHLLVSKLPIKVVLKLQLS